VIMSAINLLRQGVTCRNLIKDYGSGSAVVHALRGVNVAINPGELTLLVGPSGCGKTTLISILAATLDPTSGDLSVLGRDLPHLSKYEKAAFRARNVGFVFQQFNLLPALTAAENVAVPLVINGFSKRPAVARAMEMLAAVGLADRGNSLPSQLSGGQQQRVAIARAMIHEPRLLVCDEPTSSIDAKTGQTIMALIRKVAVQPDRVAVVVTHDARVFDFGDRIITLEDGLIANDRCVHRVDADEKSASGAISLASKAVAELPALLERPSLVVECGRS
jgi:putative ABC transport system ATP-binding protein